MIPPRGKVLLHNEVEQGLRAELCGSLAAMAIEDPKVRKSGQRGRRPVPLLLPVHLCVPSFPRARAGQGDGLARPLGVKVLALCDGPPDAVLESRVKHPRLPKDLVWAPLVTHRVPPERAQRPVTRPLRLGGSWTLENLEIRYLEHIILVVFFIFDIDFGTEEGAVRGSWAERGVVEVLRKCTTR